ncbi:MAG: sodium-dependent transporter [Melioribacter sp.]|uniref:sodium-dependent transporter n=1 Tax=Rosettibacter primus TaxID=3111523 RepID=UPI00247D6395|nr:sodium-dependent transporter [Melioribacter sp.]
MKNENSEIMQSEFFTSRWGLILSTLGIAVGTGNIWRFSRIVAQNGGGSFLIPWVIFLLIWSVPLIISEFALGKFTRKAPIGAFVKTAGSKFAWMGAFVAFVSTAIMFYYSVVTGWCIKYLFSSLSGNLFITSNHLQYWNEFSSGLWPIYFHFFAMIIGSTVIYKGVVKGIEKVNKILVSMLVVILLILFVRAITLPNALEGIKYFFTPKLEYLINYKVWLNALTQNAWDTGAGWGLILTYATYMKKKEDIALNASLIGFGNNSISLLAGIIIFSTVFALSSNDALQQISLSGPANTGLTFIVLPQLFMKMSNSFTVNIAFSSLFFLALSFAALTSLISMIELAVKTLIDFGFQRKTATIIICFFGFILGIPSALNINFLINQDWVWGVGLILSGAFISFAVNKYGTDKFRKEIINATGNDINVGRWYFWIMKYIVPILAILLLSWWLISSTSWDKEWWNPFHRENLGTSLFQWLMVIIIFLVVNKKIANKISVKI